MPLKPIFKRTCLFLLLYLLRMWNNYPIIIIVNAYCIVSGRLLGGVELVEGLSLEMIQAVLG